MQQTEITYHMGVGVYQMPIAAPLRSANRSINVINTHNTSLTLEFANAMMSSAASQVDLASFKLFAGAG